MPFFRIDRTGYQAEGVVAGVVRKGTVGGKLLAVNGVLLRFCSRCNCTVTDIQPVHHLHELVPAVLAGLGRVHALLGADDQRHDIFAVAGAVIQAPFVDTGGIRLNILVQGAFLIRVQLCGVGSIRWR